MGASYESTVIGDRFGLSRPPTALARTASVAPIGFARLKRDAPSILRAKDVPPEAAFTVHVSLRNTPAEFWLEGRPLMSARAIAGDTFLFDLKRNPVSELHGPFDIMRFYISQTSLDELSREEGGRGSVVFTAPPLGRPDPVMHGLAQALLSRVEHGSERSMLFMDHMALAFHAHAIETYGAVTGARAWAKGTLSPWQLRRALDFLLARLDGDPSVAEVARECGLSTGYFARAFRQTTGTTPHQWLTRRRVERARRMLLRGLPIVDVALQCGFVDQSHFTRVFAHFEGMTPRAWQRLNRGAALTSAF